MATTVDELIVEIKASTQDLQRGLKEVNTRLGLLDKGVKGSIISFQSLGRVFAVLGLAKMGGAIVNTSRTFQDLNATLRAITGSSEAAATSMELITKFTATTTFQLENVTSAFTTLLNAGITPTSDVLQDFGNVAAAFNKDITTMAQAAFNATTGEMEMLKQFGIIAKVEGDKLAVTFDNTTTKIDRDAASIIEFIRKIGQEKFPTALEERADTVSGAFSNLADATSILFNSVGESGLNEALVALAKNMIGLVNSMTPFAKLLGAAVNSFFTLLGRALDVVRENAQAVKGALATLVTAAALQNIGNLTRGMFQLAAGALEVSKSFARIIRRNPVIALVSLAGVVAYLTGNMDGLNSAFEEIGNITDDLISKIPGLSEAMDSLDEIMSGEAGVTRSLEDVNTELDALLGGAAVIPPALKEMEENAENVKEAMADLAQTLSNATQDMTRSFVDALMDGANALDAFKNFAKSVVSQIITTFLNLAVVNHILNAIFGGVSGFQKLPTISFGGGGAGAASVAAGGAQSFPATGLNPNITSMPLRATGGSVTSGTSYLVGERGPEVFTPRTAGSISAPGGNGSQSVIVQQTINLSAGVAGTVRAEVERMLPKIAEISKAGVLEATRRGGSYRRGLLGG